LHPAATNPELARWNDVLFYSAIDGLYDAALLNAVYSVGETYFQTAARLAIYLTPIVSGIKSH
jgi:hypothetical protein